jgi:hypothetical protein
MKKGLVVIMVLSLALMASSCVPSNIVVLDASDHAKVMGDIAANINDIKPSLSSMTILTTPTVEELLNAAREAPAISNSTKTSIKYVLDLLPELEGWLAEIPAETWQAIDEIMGNVTELETIPATTGFLQEAIDSGQYDGYEWLPKALKFGKLLLEAGKDTIYNSGWAPYEEPPLVGFNVSQLWKEDLEGGIAGAVGCALADAVPDQYAVGIGGVVGGVNSSIADLIGQLADWW